MRMWISRSTDLNGTIFKNAILFHLNNFNCVTILQNTIDDLGRGWMFFFFLSYCLVFSEQAVPKPMNYERKKHGLPG